MKYIKIILSYIFGLLYALWLRIVPKSRLAVESESHPRLVVSMTSYGRRVKATLPDAVRSMLVQSKKPDKIVVWLDETEFSMNNLPKQLKKLVDRYGVEFRLCENIRSYKKLVPALRSYPEDVIVTIDDDWVYRRNTLEMLWKAYQENPKNVYCTLAHKPLFDDEGKLLPYNSWKQNLVKDEPGLLFPLGGSGTLYPPHCLADQVTDVQLFTKLAPQADDVWFWAMTLKNGYKCRLACRKRMLLPTDLLYQQLHKDASLKETNLHENQNDVQIKNVMEYFNIDLKSLANE